MKILMLNWKDLANPSSGGAEVLTEGILKELVKNGHNVTLVCSSFEGGKREEIINGYRVVRMGKYYTVQLWVVWFWFSVLSKENFNVVIDQVHGIPFFSILYMRRVKIFAFIHEVAGDIWKTMFSFPVNYIGLFLEKLFLWLYKNTPFIAVSEGTKKDIIAAGVTSHIYVIPEAINGPSQTLSVPAIVKESRPTIIYLGRLARMKRVDHVIAAAAIVKNTFPNVQLWVVGGGEVDYVNGLKENARLLNVNATFFGKISDEQKWDLLSRAHVFSSASVKEGFGLVILEAATVKTPSVVYGVQGFTEAVVNNVTGLLTEESPQALADGILKILGNGVLYDGLQSGAFEHAKGFGFVQSTKEFERIITS